MPGRKSRWPLLLAAVSCLLLAGCSSSSGPQSAEQEYLSIFSKFWAENCQGALFEAKVSSVQPAADGWKTVVIDYGYGIGENFPSQRGQAAMLVSADGRQRKNCIFNLADGSCLAGQTPDWNFNGH